MVRRILASRWVVGFWMAATCLAGLSGALDRVLTCEVRADEWVALFHHIHTRYSTELDMIQSAQPTVKDVMVRADCVAKQMGLSAAVAITDHNDRHSTTDPAYCPTGVVQPIKGEEWNANHGHACVLGYPDDKPIRDLIPSGGSQDDKKTIAMIKSRGGLVVINHPRGRTRPWKSDERFGADAIEVWNALFWKPSDAISLAWWNRFLVNGEQVAAIGGSDSHLRLMPIESPVNLVFAKSNSAGDVIAAVKARRVIVLSGPTAPRVYLNADANGDGRCDDAMVGDAVSIQRDRTIQFEATVEKASPCCRLFLLDRDGVFFSGPVGEGAGWSGDVYRFERHVHEDQHNFVRAEVRGQNGETLESLCNPIFLTK
jgi:hypothetical protein